MTEEQHARLRERLESIAAGGSQGSEPLVAHEAAALLDALADAERERDEAVLMRDLAIEQAADDKLVADSARRAAKQAQVYGR